MVDEFDEGHKFINEHTRFDHNSMFVKDADQSAFQSMRHHKNEPRVDSYT